MSDDRPRLLHRSPVYNYTAAPAVAARNEPEAVSESYQAQLSARPARQAVAEWRRAERKIVAVLDDFDGHPHAAGRELRNVRRVLGAVGRALAA